MEKKQRVKYIIFDTLSAMLAWASLFLFRKMFVEQMGFHDACQVYCDSNFWLGLLLVPTGWLALYTMQGTYRNVLRKARVKELLDTLLATVLGVTVIFFVLLIDDAITTYRNYYASYLFLRDGKPYALLPANRRDDTLYSHQGLTYGGFILGADATTVHVMEALTLLNDTLRSQGLRRVVYKALPWIYHSLPAEEPLYAIFRIPGCRLVERDISTAVMTTRQLRWKKDRRHAATVADRCGVRVQRSRDYEAFWQVLTDNLMQRHGVQPVHSLQEILLLESRFPEQIQLYTATVGDRLLAGSVVYLTPQVAHTQYIASTPEGKRSGAVDAIVRHLLNEAAITQPFLDFGKSTETHSDQLNASLLYQKEGFGGRAVCYDTYEWPL